MNYRKMILRIADQCSGKTKSMDYVKCRAEDLQSKGQEEGASYATAWSIACKYKRDGLEDADEHCKQPASGYFKKKKASTPQFLYHPNQTKITNILIDTVKAFQKGKKERQFQNVVILELELNFSYGKKTFKDKFLFEVKKGKWNNYFIIETRRDNYDNIMMKYKSMINYSRWGKTKEALAKSLYKTINLKPNKKLIQKAEQNKQKMPVNTPKPKPKSPAPAPQIQQDYKLVDLKLVDLKLTEMLLTPSYDMEELSISLSVKVEDEEDFKEYSFSLDYNETSFHFDFESFQDVKDFLEDSDDSYFPEYSIEELLQEELGKKELFEDMEPENFSSLLEEIISQGAILIWDECNSDKYLNQKEKVKQKKREYI